MEPLKKLNDIWGIQINYAFGIYCTTDPVARQGVFNGLNFMDYYLILGVN